MGRWRAYAFLNIRIVEEMITILLVACCAFRNSHLIYYCPATHYHRAGRICCHNLPGRAPKSSGSGIRRIVPNYPTHF